MKSVSARKSGRRFLLFLFEFSVCHGFDGQGILRRRHSGHFLKLSRKIVDGCVSQVFGYLGKIHLSGAHHLFRGVDLHVGKVLDDPKAALFLKDLLQL